MGLGWKVDVSGILWALSMLVCGSLLVYAGNSLVGVRAVTRIEFDQQISDLQKQLNQAQHEAVTSKLEKSIAEHSEADRLTMAATNERVRVVEVEVEWFKSFGWAIFSACVAAFVGSAWSSWFSWNSNRRRKHTP